MEINELSELTGKVIQEVERAVIGKRMPFKKILATFLSSGGHVLLEDYPGPGERR